MSDDLSREFPHSNSTQLRLQNQPEATEPASTLSVDNRTQNRNGNGEPAGTTEAESVADAIRDDPEAASGARSPRILSSPSPDAETKLSRKREREVSLEPVSSSGAGQTSAPMGYSSPSLTSGPTQTPTKKNRIHRSLDATAEEDIDLHHRSRSRSKSNSSLDNEVAATKDLGISASPPQEMKIKVRQISQGVEDLTWRNLKKQRIVKDETKNDVDVDVVAEDSIDNNNDKIMDLEPQSVPSAPISISTTKPAPKRPRDDADKDDNPRETKRPTPPPDSNNTMDEVSKFVSTSKPSSSGTGGGFMAYASTSSPFASAVKGQPSSSTKKPSIPVSSTTKSSETSSSTAGTVATKPPGSGFEAFASSSSPFASAKSSSGSKFEAFASSPSPFGSSGSGKLGSSSGLGSSKSGSGLGFGSSGAGSGLGSGGSTRFGFGSSTSTSNAFTAYASGSGGVFGTSSSSSSSSSPSPFGAGGRGQGKNGFAGFGGDGDDGDNDGGEDDEDDEDSSSLQRVALSEQEVSTGEELEETIHQVRGKLFALVDGAWKERGTGQLKINVRAEDGGGARLVMRKEAVYTLLLNVTLFAGMKCSLAQDPRYVRFSVIEGAGASISGDGENVVLANGNGAATVTTHYNLRLANAKIASELMEAIHENLPSK